MQVDEPPLCLLPSSTSASQVICSTDVSHYELQVEIGNNSTVQLFDSSLLEKKLMANDYFASSLFLLLPTAWN